MRLCELKEKEVVNAKDCCKRCRRRWNPSAIAAGK